MTTPEDLARELEALLPSVHIFISDGQYRYAAEKLASALQAQPAPQGDVVEAVARAIWAVQRNDLDKCDMELADVGNYYETYDIARAAMSVLASLPSAEAGAEPVAWMYEHEEFGIEIHTHRFGADTGGTRDDFLGWTETPLFAAPPTEAAIRADEREKCLKIVQAHCCTGVDGDFYKGINSACHAIAKTIRSRGEG